MKIVIEKQVHRISRVKVSYFPWLRHVVLVLVLLPFSLAYTKAKTEVELCGVEYGRVNLKQDDKLYILPYYGKEVTVKGTSPCGFKFEASFTKTDMEEHGSWIDKTGKLWADMSFHIHLRVIHVYLSGKHYSYIQQDACKSLTSLHVDVSNSVKVEFDCETFHRYDAIITGIILILFLPYSIYRYITRKRSKQITVSVSVQPIARRLPPSAYPGAIIRPVTTNINGPTATYPITSQRNLLTPSPQLTPSTQQLPTTTTSPVPSQPSPKPSQPSPVPSQPRPVPSQPSPVPSQPSPVPSQPNPVPSQPSPVPPPSSQIPPLTLDSELPPPPTTSKATTVLSKFKNQFGFKRLENDSS